MKEGQGGTRQLFAAAAESLVVSGMESTVAAALHARLFRPYAEGLRQYLAIRMGDVPEGELLLSELRSQVESASSSELTAEPGLRARLYRMGRELALARQEKLGGPPSVPQRESLPWRKPPDIEALAGYAEELQRLRAELDEEEAELLELAFARELGAEELAYALDLEPEVLDERLEKALGRARRIAAASAASRTQDLSLAVLEAFALASPAAAAAPAVVPGREGLPEGTIIGERYEVSSRVGSGAFGDVYRASDTEVPGHVVALKILHQPSTSVEARDTALRELHLIASVFHPSVVQLKDHGWYDERLWFVMPWYEGETLEARLRRAPLSREEARFTFERLCRALGTMHEVGIRHQDVKPDNIMLARIRGYGAGEDEAVLPVLLDLGVAAKEAEMILAGTPTYFAPEVASGFARMDSPEPVTSKADVFSLALSLRNALEPHTQEDVAAGAVERFVEYRAEHVPDPPYGKELAFLKPSFERWLAFEPDKRPTADELADELKVLVRPERVAARRARILRWAVPVIIAFLSILGAVVFELSRRAREQALEAERARSEVAEAREDLVEAAERQKSLEEDVEKARHRIRSSKLTKEQLEGRLAETEGQKNLLASDLEAEAAQSRMLRKRLTDAEAEGERLGGELGKTRSALDAERSRAKALEGTVAQTRADLAATTSRAEQAEQRGTELTGALASLREEVGRERSRAETAASRLVAAEKTLRTSRSQIATLERRVADLERRLAAAEAARRRAEAAAAAARRRAPSGGGTTPTPPTTTPTGPPMRVPTTTRPPGVTKTPGN